MIRWFKVDLLHAAPNYAIVQMPHCRETTISLKDIARCTADACVYESSAEIADQFPEICDNNVNTGQKKK